MKNPDEVRDLAERARQAYQRAIDNTPPDNAEPADPATLAKLERGVKSLRRMDREIFLANRLDAMSYAEIAERTGLSVGQVRRAMARALYSLVRYMRDEPARRRWFWPF